MHCQLCHTAIFCTLHSVKTSSTTVYCSSINLWINKDLKKLTTICCGIFGSFMMLVIGSQALMGLPYSGKFSQGLIFTVASTHINYVLYNWAFLRLGNYSWKPWKLDPSKISRYTVVICGHLCVYSCIYASKKFGNYMWTLWRQTANVPKVIPSQTYRVLFTWSQCRVKWFHQLLVLWWRTENPCCIV